VWRALCIPTRWPSIGRLPHRLVPLFALFVVALAATGSALAREGSPPIAARLVGNGDFVAFDRTGVSCFVYGPPGAVAGASGIACTQATLDSSGVNFLAPEHVALITVCCPGRTSKIELGDLGDFVNFGTSSYLAYERRLVHVPLYGVVRLRSVHQGSTLACQGTPRSRLEARPHVVCLIVSSNTFRATRDGILGYFYSASRVTTGFEKHGNRVEIHGETGIIVDGRRVAAVHIPRTGAASIGTSY
jgi:hypothetical protein